MIEFRNISKSFGNVLANQDINFQVQTGQIHGIIGENGAGKSTAMKILFGLYRADQGQIFINQKEVQLQSAVDAIKNGVGMVHQHFMLAEPMTVIDNIILHQSQHSVFQILPRKKLKEKLEKICTQYGFQVDLQAYIEDLAVGTQQVVELLKILSLDSKIIILDEPTAVLTPQEIESLFKILRQLKSEGKTILIISHKLKEIKTITDSMTVFRQGRVTACFQTSQVTINEMAEAMVGRSLLENKTRDSQIDQQNTRLVIKNLNVKDHDQYLKQINLAVHAGEIVGIAGVEGNGQDILIKSILEPLTLEKIDAEGILINNENILHLTTAKIRQLPIAALPENRLKVGALPSKDLIENFILGHHHDEKYKTSFYYDKNKLESETLKAMKEFDVRPLEPYHQFGSLSGGNQQKLVVARELSRKVDFILAAQPTRGVDIGAVEFIHQRLKHERDNGAGILLISSELDELMSLADRIWVIYKGQFVAEFIGPHYHSIEIGAAMGGQRKDQQ